MRLPTEAQLSMEQRNVCMAQPKGKTLVVGPPGSGKTVAAIFRKKYLENLEENVVAVAWNNVLSKFSGMTETFETWNRTWWRNATGQNLPRYIPASEKRSIPDYESAFKLVLSDYKEHFLKKGNWGHLILDEAQDFNKYAHQMLSTVQINSQNESEKPSTLLILADENQRITESNSDIEEIRNSYFFAEDDIYYLKENYRNTQEIAKVAREFCVDVSTGIPNLPQRTGNRPKLLTSCSIDKAVTQIANHAMTFTDYEIGVLVYGNYTRKKLVNKLKHRLEGKGIVVQTYTSIGKKGEKGKPLAEKLIFDKKGIVTVLCFASAKGVEFDSVFMPELQQMPASQDANFTLSRMQMYVMTSRARSHLYLMFDDPDRTSPVWKLFPENDKLNELFDID